MPCLADFASRRLPNEFISVWDAWLQRSIAASRERLGERWLDIFLTSPMWRFVLGAGVCGDAAWAGLLVPSVDKVGRYFPLTLASPLGRSPPDLRGIIANHGWYAELERIALSALSVDFSVAALEDALAGNPLRCDSTSPAGDAARELAQWLDGSAAATLRRDFPSAGSLVAAVDGAGSMLFGQSMAGRSFWWCVEQQSGSTELHCARALPEADYYAVLLEGPHHTATAE